GSVGVFDVAFLVLEANDPDDPVRVLVFDRELAGDPSAGVAGAALLLSVPPEGVLLARLDFRAHYRSVHFDLLWTRRHRLLPRSPSSTLSSAIRRTSPPPVVTTRPTREKSSRFA